MNLDGPAAAMCILTALSFIGLHIISSPNHRVWLNMPAFVRFGLFLAAGPFLFRGVILASTTSAGVAGHVTPDGFLALATLTYTVTAMAAHGLRRTYSPRFWDRLKHWESVYQCSKTGPALAELSMEGATVVAPAAKGWWTNRGDRVGRAD